jgi:two-component system, cell cycle response regulator DivK
MIILASRRLGFKAGELVFGQPAVLLAEIAGLRNFWRGETCRCPYLCGLLALTDYQVLEVEVGEQALASIAKQRPDLILMDLQFPIPDGLEATRRIKADPSLSSRPIIAVTAYALSGDEKKARAAGCNDLIPKPYSPRQLLAKIRQYLP